MAGRQRAPIARVAVARQSCLSRSGPRRLDADELLLSWRRRRPIATARMRAALARPSVGHDARTARDTARRGPCSGSLPPLANAQDHDRDGKGFSRVRSSSLSATAPELAQYDAVGPQPMVRVQCASSFTQRRGMCHRLSWTILSLGASSSMSAQQLGYGLISSRTNTGWRGSPGFKEVSHEVRETRRDAAECARQTVLIDESADLGAQSSKGTADRLI